MIYDFEDDSHKSISEPMERYITFHLDGEIYGIDVNKVREILRLNNNFPVPGAPDFVLGITNIRGNVVTIVDARKRFTLSSIDYTKDARMIVVELGEQTAAIVVDSVSDVIDVPKTSIDINPRLQMSEGSRFISGVVLHSTGLVIIIDVDAFLVDDQMAMASGF
ncbi:MAG: chemotaxis protein CheW [Gammaproteobacteria bacterium]|nr:MAG: chemotaxis protein CheW [Gammaproteobacteria bacterium]